MNNLRIMKRAFRLLGEQGISADRFDECRGIFRLTDKEILEMAKLCRENRIGLVMSVGPRALYDTSAFAKTPNGSRIGYRLRGMENLVRAVEDVKRVIGLGVRGILVYDEGLLHVLNRMRKDGELPPSTIFKLSVHCGCSNPASCAVYAQNGADTINPVPDLELPMLGAIRAAIDCPIDIFTDTALVAGGFIRTYEVPEFIRIASPVYLKCGPVSQQDQNHLPTEEELRERIVQTKMVLEAIRRYYPAAKRVSKEEPTLSLPEL
ncbi:MAG: peptidase [Candidatus Micrarchaeota archaeon]